MVTIKLIDWNLLDIFFAVVIAISGFLVTYLLMPYIIKYMQKKRYVGNDIHKNSKPEVAESGGIGILIGLIVASLFMMLFFREFINQILIFDITILIAGLIGYLDDRVKLRSRYKIILTLLAGIVIFFTNYFNFIDIESPVIPILGRTRLSLIYPFVIPIIVVIFANTVNMLEGYNGEGSGTCLIVSVFLLISSLIWNSGNGVLFSLLAISTFAGFFMFNKYPAKIFPGDTGTLVMGSTLACIGLFTSLEAVVFIALFAHIFNSFYYISSARGFFESSDVQETRSDIILLEDDRIKASHQKDAIITLPRLILAKGPLKEPELVKNFYILSLVGGFFSIFTTLLMLWTDNKLPLNLLIIFSIIVIFPVILLYYYYPRVRGIVLIMSLVLAGGIVLLILIDIYIISIPLPVINLGFIIIPPNILLSTLILAPGLIIWYYLTVKYFWYQINKFKEREN